MGRLKIVLTVGAAGLAALAGLALRARPSVPAPLPPPPAGERAAAAAPPAAAPDAFPAPAATGAPEGVDAFGIPQDPERVAQGIAAKVKEHEALVARLQGQVAEAEAAAMELRKSTLAGEIALWTTRLIEQKAFGHHDAFAALFRESPWFKADAAGYLAALPGDAGLAVLLDGLRGGGLLARSAAAEALGPHLLERQELPPGAAAALRKALSDDLSAALEDPATYGSAQASARDLAVSLRSMAARVLTKFRDAEATPFLVDLTVGKDGVPWTLKTTAEVEDFYRHLAKQLRASPPPLALERLAGFVDAHLRTPSGPGGDAAGDPYGAALLLDAVGQPAKLGALREHHRRAFQAATQDEVGIEEAATLLYLRDARPVDWILERLTSPREQVRNRAINILIETTGQKTPASADLEGEGSPEDKARWAAARQKWAEWWTANKEKFQLTNPYR